MELDWEIDDREKSKNSNIISNYRVKYFFGTGFITYMTNNCLMVDELNCLIYCLKYTNTFRSLINLEGQACKATW